MDELVTHIKQNKIMIPMVLIVVTLGLGYFWMSQQSRPVKNELKTEEVEVKKSEAKSDKVDDKKDKLLVVDIQGAVKNPGVYRVKKDVIVQEVIRLAGGINPNAELKQINQAQRVQDQMQIYVPTIGETARPNVSSSAQGSSKKVVNINTATVDDFKNVTGIGPKKAEKIIEYRQKNGDFKDLHALTGVSGIGEKSLDKLKDQLTV